MLLTFFLFHFLGIFCVGNNKDEEIKHNVKFTCIYKIRFSLFGYRSNSYKNLTNWIVFNWIVLRLS